MLIDVLEFMIGLPSNKKKSKSKSFRVSRKITQKAGRLLEPSEKLNYIFWTTIFRGSGMHLPEGRDVVCVSVYIDSDLRFIRPMHDTCGKYVFWCRHFFVLSIA